MDFDLGGKVASGVHLVIHIEGSVLRITQIILGICLVDTLGNLLLIIAACPHLLTLVTGADGCARIPTERKNALGCHFGVAQHGQCHIFVVFRRLGIMKDLRHHLVVFTAKHERAVV